MLCREAHQVSATYLLSGPQSPQHSIRQRFGRNRGFTLIELIVAMVVSLILIGILVRLFASVSDGVTTARNMINLENRLRAAAQRLQSDLEIVTLMPKTSVNPESDQGYFEIIEGPKGPVEIVSGASDDLDDMLMFTVRSKDKPFVGRWQDSNGVTQIVESQVAEIAWFVRDGTLYRRVLLVLPDLPLRTPGANQSYYALNDIAAREVNGLYSNAANLDPAPPPALVANTLGDLTNRENRFAHQPYKFPSDPRFWYEPVKNELLFPTMTETSSSKWPFPLTTAADGSALRNGAKVAGAVAVDNRNNIAPDAYSTTTSNGQIHINKTDTTDYTISDADYNTAYVEDATRFAEDVVLENVASFDVKVWDTGAPLVFAKIPYDPSHDQNIASSAIAFDLGDRAWDVYGPNTQPNVDQANYPGITLVQKYPETEQFNGTDYGWEAGALELELVSQSKKVNGDTQPWLAGSQHVSHGLMLLDGVRVREGTFRFDVTPGIYDVEVWVGNTFVATDDCELRVGTQLEQIDRAADEWGPDTFRVVVPGDDATITVSLKDSTPDAQVQTVNWTNPNFTHSTRYSQLCGIIVTPAGAGAVSTTQPPPQVAAAQFDFYNLDANRTASGWVAADYNSVTSHDGLLTGEWQPAPSKKEFLSPYNDPLTDDCVKLQSGTSTFKMNNAPFTGVFSIRIIMINNSGWGARNAHVWFNGTGPHPVSVADGGSWQAATGSVHVNKGEGIEIKVAPAPGSTVTVMMVAAIDVSGVSDTPYEPPIDATGGFDPNGIVLQPGQLGYYNGLHTALAQPDNAQLSGFGAFVDLNYMSQMPTYSAGNSDPSITFGGAGHTDSGLNGIGSVTATTTTGPPSIFDTWSTRYARTDGTGTSAPPPYDGRVEAIQIRLRVLDPASQLLREVTVVQDFLDR